jgi:hypothetical protein
MTEDTPPHIKQLQLEIWLSKPPMERLRLTLENNDDLFALWKELTKDRSEDKPDNLSFGCADHTKK